MPDNDPLSETKPASRRVMVLFFLIDTSGSMEGTKIATVNSAIEDVIPELKRISQGNDDAEIKVAVLTFSSGAEWITSAPVSVESFCWNPVQSGGLTDFGEACKMLNEKLSRSEFLNEQSGSFAPALFLLSDGGPTDSWKRNLDELKKNNWYQNAIKIAVAIGDDCNDETLERFTGSNEAVLHAHTPEALTRMIKFVSVRSSQIGSKSTGVKGGAIDQVESKQDEVIEAIKNNAQDLTDVGVGQW